MALDVYKDWLGIPEGLRPPDHYQLLRLVQFEDETAKINAHYKKLNAHVRKYATGQYSVQSQELLNELAKAMLCLVDPERKREYDESLGREFPAETTEFGRVPMETVLSQQGHLTREQVKEVEGFAEARGLSVRDAVVQMKLVDAETAAQALAQELRLPYLDLADMYPDDSVLDKVPRNLVKRQSILPLFIDNDTLLVACVDEPTHDLEDEMRLRFGVPMRAVIATPLAINQGIAKYYAPGMRDESAAEAATAAASGNRKKAGKSALAKASSGPKRRVPMAQLTEGERAQRKQVGILMMCWSVIGAVLFDQFILRGFVLPSSWTFPYLTSLVVPPAAIFYVLKVYWR